MNSSYESNLKLSDILRYYFFEFDMPWNGSPEMDVMFSTVGSIVSNGANEERLLFSTLDNQINANTQV